MMMMKRSTLGVSGVRCDHVCLHPDTFRSNSHLYRTAHQRDATAQTERPDRTSSDRFARRQQRPHRAATIRRTILPRRQQSSNGENPNVHRRRLLPVLVAVRDPCRGEVFGRLVQGSGRSRVRSDVARERQQCGQRVHLLVD